MERQPRTAVLVALVVLTVPALPSVQAQESGVLPSSVEIAGETPASIQPMTQIRTTLEVRYDYPPGTGSARDTQVNVSVSEKPEWLSLSLTPQQFTMAADSVSGRSRQNITVTFRVAEMVTAFDPEPVTLHVRADRNGAIADSENTFSWLMEVGFVPRISMDLDRRPLRLDSGDVGVLNLIITNLGNAEIRPSYRLVQRPQSLQVGVGDDASIIGSPYVSGTDSSRIQTPILVKDLGGASNQATVPVEVSYRPAKRVDVPPSVEVVRFSVIRSSSGAVVPFALTGLLGGGLAAFVLWRRKSSLHSIWPE